MTGTRAGGLKAATTNKKRWGENFYADIGRKGGQSGNTGGFAANPVLAKIAGRKGGLKSRRGPSLETKRILDKNRAEILKLAFDGVDLGTIAGIFGVNRTTLERWLDKN